MRAVLLLLLAIDLDPGPAGDVITAPPQLQPHAAAASCSHSIECSLQSGDKVGNWWALKADGTMLSGSSLTQSGQASPGVSPLTFNGSTQYFKSSNVSFPSSGNVSAVVVFNYAAAGASNMILSGKWGASPVWVVFLDTSGKVNIAVKDGGAGIKVVTAAAPAATNTWLYACLTWNSATKAVKLRTGAGNVTDTTASTGIIAASYPHAVGAGADGSLPFAGQSRGAYYGETLISDADCDRIGTGAL